MGIGFKRRIVFAFRLSLLACLAGPALVFSAVEGVAGEDQPAVPGETTSHDIQLKFGNSTLTVPRATVNIGLEEPTQKVPGGIPVHEVEPRTWVTFDVPSDAADAMSRNPKWSKCIGGVTLATDGGLNFDGYADREVDWNAGPRTQVANDIWRVERKPEDFRVFPSTFFEIDPKVIAHASGRPIRFSCKEKMPNNQHGACQAVVVVAPEIVAVPQVSSSCLEDPSRALVDLPVITRDVLYDTLTYLRPRIRSVEGAREAEAGEFIRTELDLRSLSYCPLSLTGGRDLVDLAFWEKDVEFSGGYRTTGRSLTLRLPAAVLRRRGACGGGPQTFVSIGWPENALDLAGGFAPKALSPPKNVDAFAHDAKARETLVTLRLQSNPPRPFSEDDLAARAVGGPLAGSSTLKWPAKRLSEGDANYCGFEMFVSNRHDDEIFDHVQGKRVPLKSLTEYPFNVADYFLRRGPSGLYETALHCGGFAGDPKSTFCVAEGQLDTIRYVVSFNGAHLCQGEQLMSEIEQFLKDSVVARTEPKKKLAD